MIGSRFGMLYVVARAANDTSRHARYVCHCDCGGHTIATATCLRRGHTRSCGCLRFGRGDRGYLAAADLARAWRAAA